MLKEGYNMLEKDLDILGATAVEDKLQVGVPSALLSMRAAGDWSCHLAFNWG